MRILFKLTLCFCCVLNTFSADLPPGFRERVIAEGLDPTRITAAPDGRIFITNKDGRIFIIENGALLPDPFVHLNVDFTNERGLSGIAFHPDFDLNHWVYVYYTVAGENRNRISRLTANGNTALLGSEVIIMDLDILPGNIHNAGPMLFLNDGTLLIATGDGADAATAQRFQSLHGKILRIRDDGSIPPDNPYYNVLDGNYKAIYALGFRNPFTMAYHSGLDMVMINDVGASAFEEVNRLVPGGNYGWNLIEGYAAAGQNVPDQYIDPVYVYSHSQGCAVIGAAFYQPALMRFPEHYQNKYFFGDYCRGILYYMDAVSGTVEGVFATGIDRPVDFLVTDDGAFYYIERRGQGGGSVSDNTSSDNGRIMRIEYTGSGEPFISSQPSDQLVSAGEDATFEVRAGGESPLHYQWFVNESPIENNFPFLEFSNVTIDMAGTSIYVIVSNASGSDTSRTVFLHVTANQRPYAEIFTSHDQSLYKAGDTIFFSGNGTDPEDGHLEPGAFTWWIDFHHNTHTHPALSPVQNAQEGMYVIPSIGETDYDVWYRVYLRVTDSEGLSYTTYTEIYPEIIQITINSKPSGAAVRVNSQNVTAPFVLTSVYGIVHSVSAERLIHDGNQLLIFEGWENQELPFEFNFAATTEMKELTVLYTEGLAGRGSGLLGHYFDGHFEENVFSGHPAFRRVDSIINFDWNVGSPDSDLLGNDDFAIRWTGKIESIHSGFYTFYTVSDDGVRLWIDDQLIIDQWVLQPETEHSATILLERQKQYNIRIEYFERGGHAVMRLLWSSDLIPKSIVPTSQLYPDKDVVIDKNIVVALPYPNPLRDLLNITIHTLSGSGIRLLLFDMNGRLVLEDQFSIHQYQTDKQYPVHALSPGMYILKIISAGDHYLYKIIKH